MKIIYYATQNKAKFGSLKRNLADYGIEVVHADIDLSLAEPRIDDVQIVAEEKVMAAFKQLQKPVVALDAGCHISALNGFPGAFVNHALKTIGLKGILKLLEDEKTRDCEFLECLAYFDGKDKPIFFRSCVLGRLARSPRGKMNERAWSVLSRIFIPMGEIKTLTQMNETEYTEWSKRRHFDSHATKFAKWFLNQKETT